jgi:hypothetical protein
MATTQQQLQPLEITAITNLSEEIKAEKAELKDLYDVNKEDRDTDRINALGDSIATHDEGALEKCDGLSDYV